MKTMGILFMGILTLMLMTSCEELTNMLDDFGMTLTTEYHEVDLIIPPAPAGIEVSIQQLMQNDIDQTIAEEGYADATVTSIKVQDAYILVMDDSQVQTLNAIESLLTEISTNELPEATLVSCVNNIPDATTLPMESEDQDISAYMQNTVYLLTIHGTLKETLLDTLHIQGFIKYHIELDVRTNL